MAFSSVNLLHSHRLPDHKVKECGAASAGTKPLVGVSTLQGSAYCPAYP